MPGSVCDVIVKIVILFLVFMGVMAMFGKLRVPVGRQRMVTVPAVAVRRVGQLELVHVQEGSDWQTRHIKTGRRLGDAMEVLSGLAGGETIGWEVSDNG